MTATTQCFITYSGDDQQPRFTIYRDAANTQPMDISAVQNIIFIAQRDPTTATVVNKTMAGAGIVFTTDGTDGQFDLILVPTDTLSLSGFYFIVVTLIDVDGKVSTTTIGRWQVGPTPTWTYSGDPKNSPRDAVRSYIGDVDPNNQLFLDPQIDQFLRDNGGALFAAAAACQALALRFATLRNKRVGDLSLSYSGNPAQMYRDMATDLRQQAALGGGKGAIYTGGISRGDMEAYSPRHNQDNVGAFTTRDAFTNNGPQGGIIAESVKDGGD